jgi:hypothetical protein
MRRLAILLAVALLALTACEVQHTVVEGPGVKVEYSKTCAPPDLVISVYNLTGYHQETRIYLNEDPVAFWTRVLPTDRKPWVVKIPSNDVFHVRVMYITQNDAQPIRVLDETIALC